MATQLVLDNVDVVLSDKPKCKVTCPFTNCVHISTLSVLRQSDFRAPTKFNTFNFERHYRSQHVNKKRMALEDITNNDSGDEMRQQRNTNDAIMEKEREDCQKKIALLEKENSELKQNQLQQNQQEQTSTTHDLKSENEELRSKISMLQNENSILQDQQQQLQCEVNQVASNQELGKKIHDLLYENMFLRHELMDFRKTIRAVCRIKPEAGQQCYRAQHGDDRKSLKLSKELLI